MMSTRVRVAALRHQCSACSLKRLCLPCSLDPQDMAELDALVTTRLLHRDEALYRPGERLRSIYVVRSGSVQTHIAEASGVEQVIGFYLPGDLVGLDALHNGRHTTASVALETSNICAIPYYRLEKLCAVMPKLNHQFSRLMAKEISSEQQRLLSLGRRDLEQRLSIFLLDLSRRWGNLGYSPIHFRLAMGRHQIASYLGSAPESISRTFSKLSSAGLLSLRGREVSLLNLPKLQQLGGEPIPSLEHLSAG